VVLPPLPGVQEGWGLGPGGKGAGAGKSSGTTLSASYEAAVSHTGKIYPYCNDGGPVPLTLPLRGSLPVAGRCALVAGKGRWFGGCAIMCIILFLSKVGNSESFP
jgi:hypothetical protein